MGTLRLRLKTLMALRLAELVNSEVSAEVSSSNTWTGKDYVTLQEVPWEGDVTLKNVLNFSLVPMC